jgi:hypothetical protein
MSILSILLSPGPGCHTLSPLEDQRPRRSTPVQKLPLLDTSMRPVLAHVPRWVTCPRTWPAHTRVAVRLGSDTKCNTPATPWPGKWQLSRISRLAPQTNTSLSCTLCPHHAHPETTSRSYTHPQIAPDQACLTWSFFQMSFRKRRYTLLIWVSYQSY